MRFKMRTMLFIAFALAASLLLALILWAASYDPIRYFFIRSFSRQAASTEYEAILIAREMAVVDDDLAKAIELVEENENKRINPSKWVSVSGSKIGIIAKSDRISGCGSVVIYRDYRIGWVD